MTVNPNPDGVPLVESLFCRLCRRGVNTRVGPTGVTFLHAVELRGGTVDHRADPVPVTEVDNPLMECDFCSAPDALDTVTTSARTRSKTTKGCVRVSEESFMQ